MATIAASDVTVTVNSNTINGNRRTTQVTVAFGDGVLTYPAGGIPLPAIGDFGMINHVDDIRLSDSSKGYLLQYDKTNHKLRVYEQGARTGSTAAADSVSGALAEGGTDGVTETAVRLMGSSVDTDYSLGALKEMRTPSKPPAITAEGLAVGY